MGFTPEQEQAVQATGKVIVSASAGSGKTTVMIEKIIRLITSGVGVDEILAVTFTNKAAAQMKEKLAKAMIEEINRAGVTAESKANLKRQLSLLPTADISTIHAYCAKLLRTHFFTAGVESGFRVIGGEDAEGRALKSAALEELFEEGYEEQEENFLHLLSAYWRKKTDNRLRKIFLDTYAALRDKADYRGFLENTLLGYTEGEFSALLEELLRLFQEKCRYYLELVEAETAYFSSIEKSEKQLALCGELTAWLQAYEGASDYFAAAAIPLPKLTSKSTKKEDSKEKRAHIERLAFLKERIQKLQKSEFEGLLSREEELAHFLLSGKTAAALARYLLRFDEQYELQKTERGALDYNDLEHKALALLSREDVAREVRGKYRYVFVDEYQDVNPVQEAILSRLAGDNLFLVGDVKQSIYGFRGSRSAFFAEKQARLAGGEGRSLYMRNNFRSCDRILDAVNAQFSLAMTKRVCDVDYLRGSYMERGGRYATNSGKVQIYFAPKEEKNAEKERGVYSVRAHAHEQKGEFSAAAKRIARIIQNEVQFGELDDVKTGGKRKVRYGDIAVLTRKKSGEIAEEVEALVELGIPVTAASAVNVCAFSEVKTLIDILSLLDNAEQDIPLCSALLSGMGNLTTDELAEIRLAFGQGSFRAACRRYARERQDGLAGKLREFYAYFEALRRSSCVLSVGEALAKILADCHLETGLLARKNGRACLKRIRRFLEEATTFGGSSIHEFLQHLKHLDYRIEYSESGGEDSVKVMTMHASKGLEFPVVILPNLSQPFAGGDTPEVYVAEGYGLAPRAFDGEKMLRHSTLLRKLCEARKGESERKDELNLYYVALTRAEQHLHLLFADRPPMPDVKLAKSFAEFTDFSVWEQYIEGEEAFDLNKLSRQALLTNVDERKVDEILRAAAWKYPFAGYENLPVKSSPTQLLSGGAYTANEEVLGYGRLDDSDGEERGLAVDEGTAYHAFLERFDFGLLFDGEGNPVGKEALFERVRAALRRFAGEVEVALLREDKLVEILSNSVFARLRGTRIYKEQQFLVSLPVKDTYAKKEGANVPAEGEEEMLFQGAIDLLSVGEEVRIIDYKYSKRSAEELKRHYQPQLDLYRRAAAKILKTPLEKVRCSIVNIRLGFEVEMS